MDYLILVNRDNVLDNGYIPIDLVDSNSKYKNNILVNKEVLDNFLRMKKDANKLGFEIDIMSGYRDYYYQEKIYNRLIKEKGFFYAFRHIAPPGASEHQTGLAIDICIYIDDKCYVEHELDNLKVMNWITNNAYKYGFILRYPKDKEDITGYDYESWHLRYVGLFHARRIHINKLVLEEYVKKLVNK